MWTKNAKSSHYKICTFSDDNLVWRNDSCARKGASVVGAHWNPWSWQQWASARGFSRRVHIQDPGCRRAPQGTPVLTKRPGLAPRRRRPPVDHLALINWQVHHGSRPNCKTLPPVDTPTALSKCISPEMLSSHFSVLFKVFAGFSPPYFSVSRWPVIIGRKQSCVHCPRPCWAVSSQLKQLIGRLEATFSLNGKLAVSKKPAECRSVSPSDVQNTLWLAGS